MGAIQDKAALRALGRRLRVARQGRKLTQESLAERARLRRRYIIRIEMGEGNPTFLTLRNLAKALRVPVRELTDPD